MPWTYESPLGVPRQGLAAATCDAPAPQSGVWIYAIGGGIWDGAVVATVEAYDTSTQSWSPPPPIQPMLTARVFLAAASGRDGLHALGGEEETGTILTTHEIYDPATGQWSPALSMPTARAGHAAVTGPDGLIYVIGGREGSAAGGYQYFNSVDAYDPVKGVWVSPPPKSMSTPRAFHAAVTGLDGAIYAIGGTNSEGLVSTVEAYNPSLGQWLPKLSPPAVESLAGAVDHKGLIYAIGGSGNDPSQPSVYSYDPARPGLGWLEQDSLQTARALLAAVTGPDGLIYAIGGFSESSPYVLGTVEAYAPPDPCAAIAAQLESFNEGDWENPQAALVGLRGLISELRECLQQHGGWPVIRG